MAIRSDDLMFSAAKAFHAYGLGNSMTFPMSVGAAAVLLPDRPTPDAVLEMMQQHQPTMFGGVPTLYAALLANPCIGAGRRFGPAAPLHLGRRGAAGGHRAAAGSRSSASTSWTASAPPRCCTFSSATARTTSATAPAGKPVPGYEARIVDEHGRPVPHGEAGELVVRGASAAEGYWNQRAEDAGAPSGANGRYTGDTYTARRRRLFPLLRAAATRC